MPLEIACLGSRVKAVGCRCVPRWPRPRGQHSSTPSRFRSKHLTRVLHLSSRPTDKPSGGGRGPGRRTGGRARAARGEGWMCLVAGSP
eukprot:1503515-Pleurochrysis_carterae.AAC.2